MKLEDRLRESLDASVRAIDAATLSRLNQARAQALEERRERRAGWIPVTVFGVGAMLAVGLQMDRPLDSESTLPDVAAEPTAETDLNLLLDAESDLDMLADLEFYLWLDAQLDETSG